MRPELVEGCALVAGFDRLSPHIRPEARQMRVCRASSGGLTGGQGPTRASQVYLILITWPMKIKFGSLIVFLFSFHKPFQPPFTW
jgi:hypothetical protein